MGADPAAELVEEVDIEGRVRRVVTRGEMRRGHLRHRAVAVVVVDLAGEHLLVHHRADWKDVWPSRWDISFGGVVGVGEAWDRAARRELAEEAGVAPGPHGLVELGAGTFDDGVVAEVARVFLARGDGPFRFDDGEVVSVEWVALDELEAWAATRAMCPDGMAVVMPLILGWFGGGGARSSPA